MNPIDWADTIVSSATPQGVGARSILRISGPLAHAIVANAVDLGAEPLPSLPWSKRFLGRVRIPIESNRHVDSIMYAWPEFRSSTGQPMAELHLPFAGLLTGLVEEEILRRGARRSRPGEFTLRAFLAGRLDLTQAEGVLGLIEATSLPVLREAIDQRSGGISRPIAAVRAELLDVLADLEAGLDFVEEDISFVSDDELKTRLSDSLCQLDDLQAKWDARRMADRLPRAVLIGPPNVGKSRLFNVLVGTDRMLVSDEAGATRDWVAAELVCDDVRFELVDTAGIEDRAGEIGEAAARLRESILSQADLVLACRPASEPHSRFPGTDPRVMLVGTKLDLTPQSSHATNDEGTVLVSVLQPESVENLRVQIAKKLGEMGLSRSASPVSIRVSDSLLKGREQLAETIEIHESRAGQEVVAMSLRVAIDQLGEIVGAVYTDDLLDRIFSRFCIGK